MPNASSTATRKSPQTSGPKPTDKQLSALRRLANQTGTTFVSPKTRWDASREISRLITLADSIDHRLERSTTRRERRAISADLAERPRDATAIRDDEVSGWGSSAHWVYTGGIVSATRAVGRAGCHSTARHTASRVVRGAGTTTPSRNGRAPGGRGTDSAARRRSCATAPDQRPSHHERRARPLRSAALAACPPRPLCPAVDTRGSDC
jgi:hypothetical protein